MKITYPLLAVLASTLGASAQDWPLRDSDVALNSAEASQYVTGRTVVFYDDGQSKFSVGGAYSYTYANDGGSAFGTFSVRDDGAVCIDYKNGFSRCDLYVRSGANMVMITQKGERFPIRP
ncbi:hypothetical protein SuNHUV7_08450 (plasmid) [Pseudoseohaeicola sp. NH-UV-7]|uniref:hypothetical protein n=1 Tax=unclassified Sulfitobacter TaxID=196795 RepID=UPI000E0AA41E|nr:hypothetical protein [Sulfitobacter sp. JL08]AXI53424.1 hypothetical protein C1J05_01945 [Sulfitobacter sp. JL08]